MKSSTLIFKHLISLNRFYVTVIMAVMMVATSQSAFSQNGVGINSSGAAANANAMLDVESVSKGVLLTPMTAAQAGAISTSGLPAGLTVFVTNSGSSPFSAIGYYYWDGSVWQHIGNGNGTVTSVGASGPLSSSGGTTPNISFSSQSANTVLAAPNGSSGAPSFRALVAADLPTVGTSGTFANPSSITIDAYGRVTSTTAGSGSSGWGLTGNGTSGAISPTTYGTTAISGGSWLGTTAATQDMVFGTNNLERMRIGGGQVGTAGWVGIGTANPSGILDVEGDGTTATGAGAGISLFAQDAGSSGGVGGIVTLRAGAGSGTSIGGGIFAYSGVGGPGKNGGSIDLFGGSAGTGANGSGGSLIFESGGGGGTTGVSSSGGLILIQSGSGTGTGNGGSLQLGSGSGVAGAAISLTAGSGSTSSGGSVSIAGGSTSGTNQNGGSVSFSAGASTGTGTSAVNINASVNAATNINTGSSTGTVTIGNSSDAVSILGTITASVPAGTLTGTTLASNVVTSSLTSVGTISSGTWNGTTVAVGHGGTGLTSGTQWGMPYFSTTSAMTSIGAGTTGQVLTATSSTAPSWKTPATAQGTVASGLTITGSTLEMAGTTTTGSFTPTASGTVLIIVSGEYYSNTAATSNNLQLAYGVGSGTAIVHTNGTAASNTGINKVGASQLAYTETASEAIPFSLNAVVPALTIGTTYWVDLAISSASSGATVTVAELSISVVEMP